MDLKDKEVLVIGAGISGIASANLLAESGAKTVLYDGNEKLAESGIKEKLRAGIQVVFGEPEARWKNNLDLAVISPGVPSDLPFINNIKKAGIPLWGEIELAYQCSKGQVYAITGTNGKTTTTALLGEIMKCWREEVFVVGNIGFPYTEAADKTTGESVIVAEVSSFQLENIDKFRPHICAVLNITPDHLDRHKTMENYQMCKENIAKNQTEDDVCILNYDDRLTREFGRRIKSKPFYFSSEEKLPGGIYMDGKQILYIKEEREEIICEVEKLSLLGKHNYENIMAAAAMAIAGGVPIPIIRKGIYTFRAVEHRIEYVEEVDGVKYYNDSKGTNPDAAIKAVKAMKSPTLLIGGGYDKNSDYTEWIRSFEGKVKYLVLLGETKEKIAQCAREQGFENIILVNTLEEAVKVCSEKSEDGDAVLLSPACASWDMFDNYGQRGNLFKETVKKLGSD